MIKAILNLIRTAIKRSINHRCNERKVRRILSKLNPSVKMKLLHKIGVAVSDIGNKTVEEKYFYIKRYVSLYVHRSTVEYSYVDEAGCVVARRLVVDGEITWLGIVDADKKGYKLNWCSDIEFMGVLDGLKELFGDVWLHVWNQSVRDSKKTAKG